MAFLTLCIRERFSAYINGRLAAIFPLINRYASAGIFIYFLLGNRLIHRPEHRINKHLAKLRIIKVIRMA